MSFYCIAAYQTGHENQPPCDRRQNAALRSALCFFLQEYSAGQHLLIKAAIIAEENQVLFCFSPNQQHVSGVTDWARQLFNSRYPQAAPASPVCYAGSNELRDEFKLPLTAANTITEEAIYYYVYAVLHHQATGTGNRLSVKDKALYVPLYDHFYQWVEWGKRLMHLHMNYATAAPYPLQCKDGVITSKACAPFNDLDKAKLKAGGAMAIDEFTVLSNIPELAWKYKLRNRSLLECVLETCSKKQPNAVGANPQFSNNSFHHYKEQLIDLLQRVCTISIETMNLIKEMP